MGSWKTDHSSGFLTNFRGTVTDSYAGTDPRYMDGEVTLGIWQVTVDEVLQDFDGEVPEEQSVNFPLGKGWTTEDGITVEHEKGKDSFHASSIYGKLVSIVAGETDSYGDNVTRTDGEDLVLDLDVLRDVLPERGDPQDLTIWKGITFEFAELHFDYGIDRKTKEAIGSTRTMPVAVVSVGDDDKPKKAAAKKATGSAKKASGAAKKAAPAADAAEDKVAAARAKAAAKKAEAAKAAAGSDESAFSFVDDEELRAQLDTILDEAADYGSYVDALLTVDAVVSDEDLLERTMDQDAGPWSTKG